jgi:hypothetical protein
MQSKIQSIQSVEFNAASAAVSTEHWPLRGESCRPVSGCISLRFDGKLMRSNDQWPTNDLRKAEQDLVELVMHRLSTFEALERENDRLKTLLANRSEVLR